MLYNEVRPHIFDNVVGQEAVVNSIRQQAMEDKFMSVYVFAGHYGTGKTTMAKILSLAANCPRDEKGNPMLNNPQAEAILSGCCMDFIEVDGASNNGIEQVRKLIENASYAPTFLKRKVYIIDEVHMLSNSAFNALLKLLEEPPKGCIFILCTTEVRAIPATIKSRSACYTFKKITTTDICNHLLKVAEEKGISATPEGCMCIARQSDGALRNALVLLEQVALSGEVTGESVIRSLALPGSSAVDILTALLKRDVVSVIQTIEQIYMEGVDLSYLLCDMQDLVAEALSACCGVGESEISGFAMQDIITLSEQLCTIKGKGISKAALIMEAVHISKLLQKEDKVEQLSEEIQVLTEKVALLEQRGPAPASIESVAEPVEEPGQNRQVIPATTEEPESDGQNITMPMENTVPDEQNISAVADEMEECYYSPEEVAQLFNDTASAEEPEELISESEPEEFLKEPEEEPEEKPERTVSGKQSFSEMFNSFGSFGIFNQVFSVPVMQSPEKAVSEETEKPVSDAAAEPDKDSYVSKERESVLSAIEQKTSDAVWYTLFKKGCTLVEGEEGVVYETALEPVRKIASAYLEASGINATVR